MFETLGRQNFHNYERAEWITPANLYEREFFDYTRDTP